MKIKKKILTLSLFFSLYCSSILSLENKIIVKVNNDPRFLMGDILKSAGYNAPARNAARGNVMNGGYNINWTGPLYLS